MKFFTSVVDEDGLVWVQDAEEWEIQETAQLYLDNKLRRGNAFSAPLEVKKYLKLKMYNLEHEVFACMFLDTQHRLIDYVELFQGTIDGASVYPREVVKKALELNSAAVILAHNHPSGICEPSQADRTITERLKAGLALVDIRTLDHLIIGDGLPYSFAEAGLL